MLQEISSLSVEPYEGESLIVTVFEIEKSEVTIRTIYVLGLSVPIEYWVFEIIEGN